MDTNEGRPGRAATLLLLVLAASAAAVGVYELARPGRGRAAEPTGVYVSTRGSDSNDGASPESALRTVS